MKCKCGKTAVFALHQKYKVCHTCMLILTRHNYSRLEVKNREKDFERYMR